MIYYRKFLVFVSFYMDKMVDVAFISSIIIISSVRIFYDRLPTYLGYWFWFILGVYICRLANYYADNLLRKSYYENNQYYMKLLEKAEKKRKEKNIE